MRLCIACTRRHRKLAYPVDISVGYRPRSGLNYFTCEIFGHYAILAVSGIMVQNIAIGKHVIQLKLNISLLVSLGIYSADACVLLHRQHPKDVVRV